MKTKTQSRWLGEVVAMLAAGFAEESGNPYGEGLPLSEIVHLEDYGAKWGEPTT